jgi:hypothetical protein
MRLKIGKNVLKKLSIWIVDVPENAQPSGSTVSCQGYVFESSGQTHIIYEN